MEAGYFRALFDYGYWARDRLFAAMEGITAEDYGRASGLSFDSLRAVFVHCLDTEYGWRCRLDGERDEGILSEALLPDFEGLRGRWAQEEATMRAYLAALTEADLVGEVTYTVKSGDVRSTARWQILTHIANHSLQHRSEAAEALTQARRSPGNLDIMLYFHEKAS
jgi:uncharacterized damage-inducible protein DinB